MKRELGYRLLAADGHRRANVLILARFYLGEVVGSEIGHISRELAAVTLEQPLSHTNGILCDDDEPARTRQSEGRS